MRSGHVNSITYGQTEANWRYHRRILSPLAQELANRLTRKGVGVQVLDKEPAVMPDRYMTMCAMIGCDANDSPGAIGEHQKVHLPKESTT